MLCRPSLSRGCSAPTAPPPRPPAPTLPAPTLPAPTLPAIACLPSRYPAQPNVTRGYPGVTRIQFWKTNPPPSSPIRTRTRAPKNFESHAPAPPSSPQRQAAPSPAPVPHPRYHADCRSVPGEFPGNSRGFQGKRREIEGIRGIGQGDEPTPPGAPAPEPRHDKTTTPQSPADTTPAPSIAGSAASPARSRSSSRGRPCGLGRR
jgi:hypothetical protein